jgi:hypothetical protein
LPPRAASSIAKRWPKAQKGPFRLTGWEATCPSIIRPDSGRRRNADRFVKRHRLVTTLVARSCLAPSPCRPPPMSRIFTAASESTSLPATGVAAAMTSMLAVRAVHRQAHPRQSTAMPTTAPVVDARRTALPGRRQGRQRTGIVPGKADRPRPLARSATPHAALPPYL